jgi:hypothetical protein
MISRNDRYDVDRAELKLIRVGHFLWLDRKKALKASDVSLVHAIDASLEIVWQLKREVRAELKVKREAAAAKLGAYFQQRKAAMTLPKAA